MSVTTLPPVIEDLFEANGWGDTWRDGIYDYVHYYSRIHERQVVELGVSPKQKERARQTFMKSAQYAAFIDATSGRFVKPGIAVREEQHHEKQDEVKKRNSGSDGNEPPDLHPFVQGPFKRASEGG